MSYNKHTIGYVQCSVPVISESTQRKWRNLYPVKQDVQQIIIRNTIFNHGYARKIDSLNPAQLSDFEYWSLVGRLWLYVSRRGFEKFMFIIPVLGDSSTKEVEPRTICFLPYHIAYASSRKPVISFPLRKESNFFRYLKLQRSFHLK
jgi:hypothetical protein